MIDMSRRVSLQMAAGGHRRLGWLDQIRRYLENHQTWGASSWITPMGTREYAWQHDKSRNFEFWLRIALREPEGGFLRESAVKMMCWVWGASGKLPVGKGGKPGQFYRSIFSIMQSPGEQPCSRFAAGLCFLADDRASRLVISGTCGASVFNLSSGTPVRESSLLKASKATSSTKLVVPCSTEHALVIPKEVAPIAHDNIAHDTILCHAAAVCSDGQTRLFASAGWGDTEVQIWDAATGEKKRTLDGSGRYVQCFCLSHAGSLIAIGFQGDVIKIWDVVTWRENTINANHSPYSLAFSPDGKTLASAGDKIMKIWDIATWQETCTFEVIRGANKCGRVLSIAFNHAGTLLATGDSYEVITA